MTRPIKFRVFRRYPKPEMIFFTLEELIFNQFNKQPLIDFEGVRDTVMQFTGLHDKNGVEIWEGDVVSFMADLSNPQEVHYKEGAFFPIVGFKTDSAIEVLGNVYEHPELLK